MLTLPSTTHARGSQPHQNSPDALDTDDGLRAAIVECAGDLRHSGEWEPIGEYLLLLARRESHRWTRHEAEYVGAFVAAAIEVLSRNPESLLRARSPWGLIVTRARYVARHAVGAEALCGLTGYDTTAGDSQVHASPRVVSLDAMGYHVPLRTSA